MTEAGRDEGRRRAGTRTEAGWDEGRTEAGRDKGRVRAGTYRIV